MHNIDQNEVLRDALAGLREETPPMPQGLHAAWMQRVEEDAAEKRSEKSLNRRALTRFLSIAAAMVFVVGGTLLTRDSLPAETAADTTQGGNQSVNMKAARSTAAEEPMEAYAYAVAEAADMEVAAYTAADWDTALTAYTTGSSDGGAVRGGGAVTETGAAAAAEEKKIIRTASMTLQTQTYADSRDELLRLCEDCGGWVEGISENQNSTTGLHTAWITLRIPQEALDGFLSGSESYGRVTSRNETATDVTASYQDTRLRLDTQLALMERLQALITESGSLSDLLELESQIADTQYQIDSLQSSLNRTDRQVSYSTVDITLREEKAPALTDTSVSFGERLSAGLKMGCEAIVRFAEDALVFLTAALPFIGIVAVAAAAIIISRKMIRRKKS